MGSERRISLPWNEGKNHFVKILDQKIRGWSLRQNSLPKACGGLG